MSATVPVYLRVINMDTRIEKYITISALTITEAEEMVEANGEYALEASYEPIMEMGDT